MEDTFQRNLLKEIGKKFSKASESYRNWAIPQKGAVEILISAFGGFVSKNEKVLDVGAGVGLLTEELLKISEKVSACDISFNSLKLNPAPRRVLCNAECLPFKNNSFDWSFSNFALHWCDWKKAFGELLRVSKRGFFVSLPVEGSLKGIGFPFPKTEEVLKFLEPEEFFIREIEIPFRGRDFLLFFKRTGTGFNPNKTLSAFDILKNPQRVEFYGFKVLFLAKTI